MNCRLHTPLCACGAGRASAHARTHACLRRSPVKHSAAKHADPKRKRFCRSTAANPPPPHTAAHSHTALLPCGAVDQFCGLHRSEKDQKTEARILHRLCFRWSQPRSLPLFGRPLSRLDGGNGRRSSGVALANYSQRCSTMLDSHFQNPGLIDLRRSLHCGHPWQAPCLCLASSRHSDSPTLSLSCSCFISLALRLPLTLPIHSPILLFIHLDSARRQQTH